MEEAAAIPEMAGAAAAGLIGSASSQRPACTNCGTEMSGRFCGSCGQAADGHRRSVSVLLKDLFKDIASFDSRILRTAYALLAKPGELALAFREGRTQRYMPPIRLYLFASLIFFLVLEISGIALVQFAVTSEQLKPGAANGVALSAQKQNARRPQQDGGGEHYTYIFSARVVFLAQEGSVRSQLAPQAHQRIQQVLAPGDRKRSMPEGDLIAKAISGTIAKLVADPAALNGALTAWMPRVLFLLLPLFALILSVFYGRQRGSLFFVDHLVFSLGFHSFAYVLLLAAAALAQIIAGEIALGSLVVVLAAYLLFAMKRFYGQNWYWTSAKWASVLVLYAGLCVLPAIAGVIAACVFWG